MTPRLLELLGILQEEAAEVTIEVSKIRRFGLNEDNHKRFMTELGDFMAVFKEIAEEGFLDEDFIFKATEAKLIKLEKYMTNKKVPASDA